MSHIPVLSHTAVSAGYMLMLPPCLESAVAGHMLPVRFGTEQFLLVWFGIEQFLPAWFGIRSFGYGSRKRAPRRC